MAENLLRLASIVHEPRYREIAERTLLLYAKTFRGAMTFSAAYVRALARYLAPEVTVRVTGDLAAAAELRRAARQLPSPFVAVSSEPGLEALAYLCRGTACGSPVGRPPELAAVYAALT
jgi:uncharacterized protein YyaL (SSP411 family)